MVRRVLQSMFAVLLLSVAAGFLPPEELHATEHAHLQWSMQSLESSWGECTGKPCVTLRVRYPLFAGDGELEQTDSLNVFIKETLLGKYDPRGVRPVLDAVRDSIVAQFRALPPSAPRHPWTIERTIAVLSDTLGVLSLDVVEFRQTGGAHPTTIHLLYMIRPATMEVLGLDDIIPPGRKQLLTDLCEKAFRKARHIPPQASLADEGFTFNGKFALTMNVGLTREGMLFYYNPYEIAPYVMGPTKVIVKWPMLKGILLLRDESR